MTRRANCGTVLLAALASAGCGTVANLCDQTPGGKADFGGVQIDRAYLRQEGTREPAWAALTAVDVPFSLVGDVVSLPYVRLYRMINEPVLSAPLSGPVVVRPPAAPAASPPVPATAPQAPTPAVAVPTPSPSSALPAVPAPSVSPPKPLP